MDPVEVSAVSEASDAVGAGAFGDEAGAALDVVMEAEVAGEAVNDGVHDAGLGPEDATNEVEMQPPIHRMESELEPHGEPESRVEGAPAGSSASIGVETYGPHRPVSDLTLALRRSVRSLDFGRPSRSKESQKEDNEGLVVEDGGCICDEEVLITEEVCVAELEKKRKAEVSEREVVAVERENLVQSKMIEWKKIMDTKSVKVHVGQEAERLIKEVGRERLLASRFIVTRSDDEE